MKSIWTNEEIDYLIQNYEYTKTKQLLSVLTNKTNDQIRWKAKDFKLKKKTSKSNTTAEFLENLDDPESLYWWGFLTADGCFTPKEIIFSLEKSDAEYVKKFANKCNSNIRYVTRTNDFTKLSYTMVRTSVSDTFLISRLIARFKIVPQKTYNPFDLSEFLTKDRLIYYLSGFVDGDGYIAYNKNCTIVIKLHGNWYNTLKLISDKLNEFYNIHSKVNINSKGYVTLHLNRKKEIKYIFDLLKGKVPIMPRKWDKIGNYYKTVD